MELIGKALAYLLRDEKASYINLKSKYARFRQFAKRCNQMQEEMGNRSDLAIIEQQLNDHA